VRSENGRLVGLVRIFQARRKQGGVVKTIHTIEDGVKTYDVFDELDRVKAELEELKAKLNKEKI
jgi:hypothetical protein